MEDFDGSLFLLGGYDLEMVLIRELLLRQGFTEVRSGKGLLPRKYIADKKLSWGARLSAYRDFLEYEGVVYGIELTEDMIPPANYKRIDHHNELSARPSSLEQVAAVLGTELDRYGCLVAANDKGYIPALLAMGATEEEVAQIRRGDRQAQGVTERDEEQAAASIKDLREENGIAIIKSLSDKFSPITDSLYGKAGRLLVYTDNKLVYYGKGVAELAGHFGHLIKEGRAYSGGGERGYFGIADGVFTKEKIEGELISEIKSIIGHE